MLYALVHGEKVRAAKGITGECPSCNSDLIPVVPKEKVNHWRHPASSNCDPWSEGETDWHLEWKERFPEDFREVVLKDPVSGERHIADVCRMPRQGVRGAVLELQHSPISDEERDQREAFYGKAHDMYWLVHLHDHGAMNLGNFRASMASGCRIHQFESRTFLLANWHARSGRFLEKWKAAKAHVLFEIDGEGLFYLVKSGHQIGLGREFERNEFAFLHISAKQLRDTILPLSL